MTIRIIVSLASIFLIISPPTVLLAADWYVDDSVSASGNGKSMLSAFKTIQEGINAASEGDTVMVRQGTYYGNIVFKSRNIILRSTNPGNASVRDGTIIDGRGIGSAVRFSGTEDETCILTGFTIRNGFSDTRAGGIDGRNTQATIENNLITDNEGMKGGGLSECMGIIRNNVIHDNWADYFGTGGGLSHCHGTIENNTITSNTGGNGGGLFDCRGVIRSNLIAGNSAWSALNKGGGLAECDGSILNNTIVDNSAIRGGGLAQCSGTITNCIIWENYAFDKDPQISLGSIPTYSCIQHWTGGGEGNTALHPIFLDADGPDNNPGTVEDNNYRLQPYMDGSLCIDKGKNEDWMKGAKDLDGNVRIFHGLTSATVDMGAYEYDSFRFAVVRLGRTPTGEPRIRWTSRPGERYAVWSKPVLYTTGPFYVIWKEEVSVIAWRGSSVWTDHAASGRMKFYRVQVKP